MAEPHTSRTATAVACRLNKLKRKAEGKGGAEFVRYTGQEWAAVVEKWGDEPSFDARVVALSGDFARIFEPGYKLILEKVPWLSRPVPRRRTVCKVTNAGGGVQVLKSFTAGYAWAKAWRAAQPTADVVPALQHHSVDEFVDVAFVEARKAYKRGPSEVATNQASETPSRSYSSAGVLAVSPSAIATALALVESGANRCSCCNERRHCKGENGRLI